MVSKIVAMVVIKNNILRSTATVKQKKYILVHLLVCVAHIYLIIKTNIRYENSIA